MGDEDVPDGMRIDPQPIHLLCQPVVVISRIDHNGRIAFAVEEDVRHPLSHTGDIFIDPAGVQWFENLLAPVHPAHCFSLKFRCFFRHDRTSFLCCNAQPSLFVFVALNLTKSCLFQIHFQISIRIDGHTVNDLRPFVVFCCFAVCFVTDEKSPAGLQHPIDLSEILRKLRPEIDRFKCGCHIKPLRFKRQLCHTCLLHGTPSCRNGTGIDFSRFFYADSRVVDALHLALGTQFQQLFDVRPTAAAAVQHHGIRGRLQKVQPPFCHCAVSKVHHGVERSGLSLELGRMKKDGVLEYRKSHFLLRI